MCRPLLLPPPHNTHRHARARTHTPNSALPKAASGPQPPPPYTHKHSHYYSHTLCQVSGACGVLGFACWLQVNSSGLACTTSDSCNRSSCPQPPTQRRTPTSNPNHPQPTSNPNQPQPPTQRRSAACSCLDPHPTPAPPRLLQARQGPRLAGAGRCGGRASRALARTAAAPGRARPHASASRRLHVLRGVLRSGVGP